VTEDERAIREVIATWLRASAANDAATVLSLIADDAVFLTPGRPPFGKEAFQATAAASPAHRLEASNEVREIQVVGDWAFCWQDLTVVTTPLNGGDPVRRSGHTLTIFRRLAEGRWVVARDANLLTVQNSAPARPEP
jgi:uncharacterized protein (TIGR02246 family)